jgi:2'-5' RNA ligase
MKEKQFLNLISLPDEADKNIKRFKRACARQIGDFPGINARGHISFDRLVFDTDVSYQAVDHKMFYDVAESILSTVPAINVKINGFNFFNHGTHHRTIYAVIELDTITMRWFNFVKKVFLCKGPITPHITIASNISLEAFNKLWPHFQSIKYTDSFDVEQITILSKDTDNKGPYQIYKVLPLRKRNLVQAS